MTLIEVDMFNYVHFWAYRFPTLLLRDENSNPKAVLYQERFPAYGFPDWLVHCTSVKAEMYMCLVGFEFSKLLGLVRVSYTALK